MQSAQPTAAAQPPTAKPPSQQKRRRPTPHPLPQALAGLFPVERDLWQRLQRQEQRLDALLVRKRLDIQETLTRFPKTKRMLRVFVSNAASGSQAANARSSMDTADESAGNETSMATDEEMSGWTLRVQGKLMEARPPGGSNKSVRKFSTFLKSVTIELDPELYPENGLIEWHRTANSPDTDGFEVKRTGNQPVECKIHLRLDTTPEKFKLSAELSRICGVKSECKAAVVMALWQYIKTRRLQDTSDHRYIVADEALSALFNQKRFLFHQIPDFLAPHLLPLDPITIDYTIQVDNESGTARSEYVWDIEVDVEDGQARTPMLRFITSGGTQREITQLDSQMAMLIDEVYTRRLKRDFMLAFTRDPVGFINKWIASQSRDLEVVIGDGRVNLEAQRGSTFYNQPWVGEAVFQYLASKGRQ